MLKRFSFWTVAAAALCMINPLHADIDEEIFAMQDIEESPFPAGRFALHGDVDAIGRTHFNKNGYRDQTIAFSQASGSFGMVYWHNAPCREIYSIEGGYTHANICWKENPFFNQTKFDTATVALSFYSNRLCDWIWQGKLGFNVSLNHFDFNNYLTIDAILWGRYAYTKTVGLHLGILIQTGIQMDHVYPVIGFDWQFRPCWKLNAVFPTNISLEYLYSKIMTPYIGVRFFDIRQRGPKKDAVLPKALISYRNLGLEGGLQYNPFQWLQINLHGGVTAGGMLRIANRNNRSPRHFKMDPAGYLGGEIDLNF